MTHSQAGEAGADRSLGSASLWPQAVERGSQALLKGQCWCWGKGQYSPPWLGSHNRLLPHWPTFSVEWKEASSEGAEPSSGPAGHSALPEPSTEPLFSRAEPSGRCPEFPSPPRGNELRKSAQGFYCQIFLSLGGRRFQTPEWRLELVQP